MKADTATATAERLEVPLRPCASWYEEIDHGIVHPHDRSCTHGLHETVPMTAAKPVRMGDGKWWHDWVSVYMRREHDAVHPHIVIANEGSGESVFAVSDALDLRDLLDTYTELAEQAAAEERRAG